MQGRRELNLWTSWTLMKEIQFRNNDHTSARPKWIGSRNSLQNWNWWIQKQIHWVQSWYNDYLAGNLLKWDPNRSVPKNAIKIEFNDFENLWIEYSLIKATVIDSWWNFFFNFLRQNPSPQIAFIKIQKNSCKVLVLQLDQVRGTYAVRLLSYFEFLWGTLLLIGFIKIQKNSCKVSAL